MSYSNAWRLLAAIVFILSKLSLPLANRHKVSSNVDSTDNSAPSRSAGSVKASFCKNRVRPILPPSPRLPISLWSMRAQMYLQILPDGKINGTLQFNKYAKLNIETVTTGACAARIKGVESQRYLVMQPNGTLTSQTQPDEKGSTFNVQLPGDFFAFENRNYFIALKYEGTLRKIMANRNGTSTRKSTKFMLIPPPGSRKRRHPLGFGFRRMVTKSDYR